ncbi:MAG: hypothetical protein M1401_06160 [Chloroflexi bacterium]|nr:hypothetical protein [Chloroflexota bacterium]
MADAETAAPASGTIAPAPAAKPKKSTTPQVESQDDLAYLKGEHGEAEQQKQVRSPNPRRPNKQNRQSSRGERR